MSLPSPTSAAAGALTAQKVRLDNLITEAVARGARSVFVGILRTDSVLHPILIAYVIAAGYTYNANNDRLSW